MLYVDLEYITRRHVVIFGFLKFNITRARGYVFHYVNLFFKTSRHLCWVGDKSLFEEPKESLNYILPVPVRTQSIFQLHDVIG